MNDRHDDEGVIDLSALAASPSRGAAPAAVFRNDQTPAAFARDAASSGLGPSAADPTSTSQGLSKAKTIGAVAGAVAVLILAGVGIAFAFRGEKPVAIAAPAPPPPPFAAATAAPLPSAAEAAPTSQSDDDETTADANGKKAKGAGKARRGGAGAKAPSTSAPKAPVVKAADPCHCHGDFQCNIRCSAGK